MKDKCVIFIVAIIAICYYIMNCLTPYNQDDFVYMHICGDENMSFVTSVSDIVSSQVWHYSNVNGRFPVHFIEQFFAGIAGKPLFNILNTLVYVLLIWQIFRLITRHIGSKTLIISNLLLLLFLSSILFFSFPGQTMLWMAGSVNYQWVMMVLLIVTNVFYSSKDSDKGFVAYLKYIFLFLFSIIAGWTQEGIVIPIIGALLIWSIFHRSDITISKVVILVGLLLGVLLIVFSPGTINRIASSNLSPSKGHFLYLLRIRILDGLYSLRRVYIAWICLIVLIIEAIKCISGKRCYANFCSFGVIAFSVNFLFVLSLGDYEERVTYPLSIWSVIVLIETIYRNPIAAKLLNSKNIAFMLVVLLFSVNLFAIRQNCNIFRYWESFQDKVNMQPGREIVVKMETIKPSRYYYSPKLFNPHPQRDHYLGKDCITVLPSD